MSDKRKWMTFSLGQLLAVLLVLLVIELAGCAPKVGSRIPPCPLTTEAVDAEAEDVKRDYPDTDRMMGRYSKFCEAIERLREK